MDSIDEIRKRQEDEIGKMLQEQYRIWQDLKSQHDGKVPEDIANEYRKAARLETMALEERQVEEREAIPFYGKVLSTERALVTEMRGLHDTIENQQEMDRVQDEMDKLLEQARIRENNRDNTPQI
ncbi:hypothetical protein [Dyadobacter sp. CY323]|uniref:hypothetical protein n=1 Tax=Dyadobacter sp. CY323 TaxID=2907302 RepID=UPI001F3C6870|nr:hypothetical protein [Dyadobacter sp. CY323]MCE6993126.1 hypothetical protein [Dyadobacter sp. CY323]